MNVDSNDAARLIFSLIHKLESCKAHCLAARCKVNGVRENMLSERQYVILCLIHYANIHTLTQISRATRLSASGLSIVISKMEKNGLIAKRYDVSDDDKRKVYFVATEDGLKEMHSISSHIIHSMARIFDMISSKERADFKEAMDLIKKAVPEMGYISVK